MTFGDAIRRPFQDLKTLIIGIIVMIIPIVNFIGVGYFLECARTGMKKNKKLPEWKDWINLFIKGIGVFVISLIYAIPALIVLALTAGATILTGGFSALMAGDILALVNMVASLGIGLIITVIVGLVMSIITYAAVMRYAEKGSFSSAFELSAISKKAFTGTFFVAWLISIVYALIVMGILSLIPVIGSMIGTFIVGVTVYTYLAEAYKRA